jgi:hypothetical protein
MCMYMHAVLRHTTYWAVTAVDLVVSKYTQQR